jgi:hypothetical protein
MDLIQLLIMILVLGLVFALLYWLIDQFPLPAPFAMAAKAILALIIVILLLGMLFGQINVPMLKIGR